ncbi:Protein NAS-27 [Aphelenchoides avenae]|nr:Protein NAS-27 [Aphelenchus avenae]
MSEITPAWKPHYQKQKDGTSDNLGLSYDYGSVMHYPGFDWVSGRPIMKAKDRAYQQTMGSGLGPSSEDIYAINLYYGCLGKCPQKTCFYGGYPNPKRCEQCVCPSGFGGHNCGERAGGEHGAPLDCGKTVDATEEYDVLSGNVTAGIPESGEAPDRHAKCYFHIKAPKGMSVEVTPAVIYGECSEACQLGGVEVKTKDLSKSGARFCCKGHIPNIGPLTTSSELAVVIAYSQFKEYRFSVRYRAVPRPPPKCPDKGPGCPPAWYLCTRPRYEKLMSDHCSTTCGQC